MGQPASRGDRLSRRAHGPRYQLQTNARKREGRKRLGPRLCLSCGAGARFPIGRATRPGRRKSSERENDSQGTEAQLHFVLRRPLKGVFVFFA